MAFAIQAQPSVTLSNALLVITSAVDVQLS